MTKRANTIKTGLTFDDVLLIPNRTSARSRKDINLATNLTAKIKLNSPIISANTPWCTESDLATVMAKMGGIGFVHRMTTMEIQAEEVQKVKSAKVDLVKYPLASIDQEGRLLVGAAIGIKGDYLDRSEKLVNNGVDVLIIDIAHGHSDYIIEPIMNLKERYPDIDIIAGNVATMNGVRDLAEAGVNAIKVGIGPGGICTTRQVAGAGVPQLTAIMDCAEEASKYGLPIIADGGMRSSGDMTKALAAGASCVMLGSLLAGTDESAALLVDEGGTKYKITTGFVTFGVSLSLKLLEKRAITKEELSDYVPEGVESTFEYQGPAVDVMKQYLGGIRSGISYAGGLDIPGLVQNANFISVTPSGRSENTPHAHTRSSQVHPDYRESVVGSEI